MRRALSSKLMEVLVHTGAQVLGALNATVVGLCRSNGQADDPCNDCVGSHPSPCLSSPLPSGRLSWKPCS